MKLDLKGIESLAKNVNEYQLESLELEFETEKLVLRKKEIRQEQEIFVGTIPTQKPLVEKEEKVEEIKKNKEILSPMAGTLYWAPAPDKAPFVKEGDSIKVGDTLCIVEAMKMMNEVKATVAGTIIKILVEDGIVVKKDQVLFEIK